MTDLKLGTSLILDSFEKHVTYFSKQIRESCLGPDLILFLWMLQTTDFVL